MPLLSATSASRPQLTGRRSAINVNCAALQWMSKGSEITVTGRTKASIADILSIYQGHDIFCHSVVKFLLWRQDVDLHLMHSFDQSINQFIPKFFIHPVNNLVSFYCHYFV